MTAYSPAPLVVVGVAVSSLVNSANAAQFTCPVTYSNGPCYTQAMNWTDAQQVCENAGSNLATITDSTLNTALGAVGIDDDDGGACFSDAPWNDWECTWVGANDLISEAADGGAWEWASGADFSFSNWGEYDPDATAGNEMDCAAVCHGGNIAGYEGDFWIDVECSSEYAFCCDSDTFVPDSGTAAEDSFLNRYYTALAEAEPEEESEDPDPYEERRLCFSTQQTWADAQALCQSIGSDLITISNEAEFEHAADTVLFSRVPDTWGLDWKCFWSGWNDIEVEGTYAWVSKENPAYTPAFGPFEAGNGDGENDDCVAICKSDCANATSPDCVDLAEYGYEGTFLIDTACSDEYSFCCDGLAADYVAAQNGLTQSPTAAPAEESSEFTATTFGVGAWAIFATLSAVVSISVAVKKSKDHTELVARSGSMSNGGVMLSMLDKRSADI